MSRLRTRGRRRVSGSFIAGPIPIAWIIAALRCGAAARSLIPGLWFHAGMSSEPWFAASKANLGLGVIREATARRGLAELRTRGLIDMQFPDGRKPLIRCTGPGLPKDIP